MRLIKRQVINMQVAQERKSQIDEGLQLAQKIDLLRQTLSSLQKQHQDFLGGMQRELTESTHSLIADIAAKKAELAELESDLRIKRIPLDAEWKNLEDLKQQTETKTIELQSSLAKVAQAKILLDERLKKAKESVYKIKVNERQIAKNIEDTHFLYEKAYLTNEEAEIKKQAQEKLFAEREEKITAKEKENQNIAEAHRNLAEVLERRKLEANDRERAINDKYATLEITLKHLNK